jgi:drug/metabolite transporter (DMT)-like permease
MLWLILSLLTALAVAIQDTWVKKYFAHLSPYDMMVYPALYSLPFFLIGLCLSPRPSLDTIYWWCLVVSLPLNAVSFLLYMQAIRISPLSLTVPYLAFTPVFMIITGAIILGEIPNRFGVIGILITCIGGYVLNIDIGSFNFRDPFIAIIREKGSWLMLIVAFIFSFAAVVGKKGILHSSPLFFTISFFVAFNLTVIIGLLLVRKIDLKTYAVNPGKGLVAGTLLFLHAISHGFAISLTKAAYMISIKRFSILFGVIFGAIFFKERNIRVRLAGATLMLSGAAMIILRG